jgi:DNA replication protein DnaC
MREAPQKKKKFLVLSGNPGCGKTYIMSALVGWAYKNFNTKRFFTEEGLFKKLTIGIEQNQAWRDVLQYCIDDEILFLDDLGTNRGNEFHKEVIYVVANTRYSAQTPTVITTNLRRDEVGKIYGERILDRLYSHDSIHLNLDDYPSLRQIDPNTLD